MPDSASPKPPVTSPPGFGRTAHEFGKRRPPPPPPPRKQLKRSDHVALLIMGTVAVASGAAAYTLLQHRTCQPDEPGVIASGQPPTETNCSSHGTSSGHGGGAHWGFASGGWSSGGSSSTGAAEASGGVGRGGFGASGHAAGGGGGE